MSSMGQWMWRELVSSRFCGCGLRQLRIFSFQLLWEFWNIHLQEWFCPVWSMVWTSKLWKNKHHRLMRLLIFAKLNRCWKKAKKRVLTLYKLGMERWYRWYLDWASCLPTIVYCIYKTSIWLKRCYKLKKERLRNKNFCACWHILGL